MTRILVVGSINMDLVVTTDRVPVVGETVIGKSFKQVAGGKGANQAVAIARLGGQVDMLGAVGQDAFGESMLAGLTAEGIGCEGVKEVSDTPSGIAAITVSDGNNSIIVAPGANFAVTPEDIAANQTLYEQADIVVHQLETPIDTITASLQLARSLGKTTVLNPAPAQQLSPVIIENSDLLVPNETELADLSGMPVDTDEAVIAAARSLIHQGARELIVTLGSRGAMHVTAESVNKVGTHPVTVVDTTAAGDSFIGGLVVALSEGKNMNEALEFSKAVSALTVSAAGAQTSLPHRDKVEGFLKTVT
ncbi:MULTISPECIES: ribokinase [unclassified Lentimonas]|uniref:ribokinase n=1 Tax=unclassified Lentimonas TaxID=2630993 RepID=UPI001322AA46|nr:MULTISPECIES: ribokinase [unclassified Lentimonas]CAA6693539.1 Ribokinase (EC [Lentimonas sp. CC19]CAA6695866.1 Ribokinase (EC [Lentimonas sp. CC10]CAA7069785.1 Ribokinase (EC [Lentimonas sp. CC11]